MAENFTRTVWKLRDGVSAPFARPEGAALQLQNAEVQSAVLQAEEITPQSEAQSIPLSSAAAEGPAAPASPAAPAAPAQVSAAVQEKASAASLPPQPDPSASSVVWISPQLQLTYLQNLIKFLQSKGVQVQTAQLPETLPGHGAALLARGDVPPLGCPCWLPTEDKAPLWAFLKRELPELRS